MEFIFLSRLRLWEKLAASRKDFSEQSEWRNSLMQVSRASSMVSAHVHIIAAIASQRAECFSEHVRLLLIVNLRRMKGLTTRQVKGLWLLLEGSPKSFLKSAE